MLRREPIIGRLVSTEPGQRTDGRVAILRVFLDHALDFRTRPALFQTVSPDAAPRQHPLGWTVPCTSQQNEEWTAAAATCAAELDHAALELYAASELAAQPQPRKRARAEELRNDWDEAQNRYRRRFEAAIDAYSPIAEEVVAAIERQTEIDRRRYRAQQQAEQEEQQRIETVVEQRLADLADELRWGLTLSHSPTRTVHVVLTGVAPQTVPDSAEQLLEDIDVRTLREALTAHPQGEVVFDDSVDAHIRARFADLPGLHSYTGLWRLWFDLFGDDHPGSHGNRPRTHRAYGSSHTSYTGFHC